ncbi:DUF3397 family protein [Caldalkalibacillus salinus]|uniref:DUF3397 family protein n=1 Tax=Caldalkalibacillus salinus TaxID=2803787 RepID=UPI001922EE18|nr:DUF3397 family protein [Caldalkalibacillus salinus]
MLVSIIAHLTAGLSLFPLLSFILLFFVLYVFTRDKRLAVHWSINVTCLLLVVSIYLTVKQLWGISIHWLLGTIIFLIISVLTYLQYAIRGDIYLDRLAKGAIRLTFLLSVPVHVVLYIWVVIRAVLSSTT